MANYVRLTIAATLWLALAAHTSRPVNLGSEGLDLSLRILLSENGGAYEAYESEDWTIVEDGDGDYHIEGLPDPTGSERYVAFVFETGDEENALDAYDWDSTTGRIVAQLVYASTNSGPFKVGDTVGSIQLVVTSGLPEEIDGEATAVAKLRKRGGALIFDDRAATITGVDLKSNGTYGATFTYDLQADDLASPGQYLAEFLVTYDSGATETLPKTATAIRVEVVDTID